MQHPFDNTRTFAPRPLRPSFQRMRSYPSKSLSATVTPKFLKEQSKTSFLNDTSTGGGSEITFSDFENDLEQENVLNELCSILSESPFEVKSRCSRKITIERAANPLYKNFEDENESI